MLSEALHFSAKVPLTVLKLDYNMFGNEGLKMLTHGLACNQTIKALSLSYCGIDERGADLLFEIVVYTYS